MEFNWTTFALEILNFLVLIWILTHFLYRPVRNAMRQRSAAIAASLAEAQAQRTAAEELKRQYDRRAADWEIERARARTKLQDEIAAERARLMVNVHAEIAAERKKDQALQQRYMVELREVCRREARDEAAGFTAQLLARLATPALEQRIGEIVLEDLPLLPTEQLQAFRQACLQQTPRISSAYLLPATLRSALQQALSEIVGMPVNCEFMHDESLIAGLRVNAGPWVLRCSLADELMFFARGGEGRMT